MAEAAPVRSTLPLANDVWDLRRHQDAEFAKLGGQAPSLDDQRAMASEAARLRDLFSDLEIAVPEPGPTDSPRDYQIRLLKPLQKFSEMWCGSNLTSISTAGGLGAVADQVVRDATAKAADRSQGSFRKPGRLREIRRVDAAGGRTVEFAGSALDWMQSFMSTAVTKVESMGRFR